MKITHADPSTMTLRRAQWTPTEAMPCGCNPTFLCAGHRQIRAVEHYHPETIPQAAR